MASTDSLCPAIDNTFGPWATQCRGGLDFTLLFEETILTILPLSFMIFATFFRLVYLSKRQNKVTRNSLSIWKLSFYGIYTALQLALLIFWADPKVIKTRASVPTAVITLLASLMLALLSCAENSRTVHPSTLLNGYLFFSLIFDTSRCRTLWLQQYNLKIDIVFTAAVACKFAILFLEVVEKRGILQPIYALYPPEAISGIFNKCFFYWLNPLLREGYSKTLHLNDLFALDRHLSSDYLQNLLSSAWNNVSTKGPHALFFMTLRALKWPLLSGVAPRLGLTAFNFCQPFLLNRAINLSQQPVDNETTNAGYGLIGAYLIVYVGIAITTGQFQHLTYRAITMIRGGLISMLYNRTTDLSVTVVDPSASLILMSADIERITTGWQTIHEMWANIIEIGLAIYLLQRQLGAACAIPVAVAIVSMAGSVAATSLVMSRQAMWLEAIERRITATTAMLSAMKGVKMCGLTDTLSKTLQDLRIDELRISKKFRKLLIWNMAFTYITPVAAPVLTFAVFSVMARNSGDKTLDTARVFTSLSLFTLLSDPLGSLIMALATFMGSVGSFHRIQEFLGTDLRVDSRYAPSLTRNPHNSKRKIESKSSSLDITDVESEKLDMSTTTPEDSALSLVDAIVVKNGSFGWDQEKDPILQSINATVPREKVTMLVGPVGCGKSTLIKALLGEIATIGGSIHISSREIAFCDQTAWHMNGSVQESIIGITEMDKIWYKSVIYACALEEDLKQLPQGDRTQIGSNGIALSGGQSQRIALARAIYALKDIIILDDVLSGLDADTENRVFHNLFGPKRLPYADHILVLGKQGKITDQGTFTELNGAGGYVSAFNLPPPDWSYAPNQTDSFSEKPLPGILEPASSDKDAENDDSRRTGDTSVYLYYIRAVGWIPTLIFVVAISSFVFCISFPAIWVKWWAAANNDAPNSNLGYYIGIYSLLGGAPMTFFSSTDTGVTVNRFSQDLQLIDMELPIAALNTFATFILCIAQMILIGVSSVYSAIAFPIVLAALYFIQKFYLRTSRQLRFLDLEAKSPLYSQFMECLTGLITIRAFGWQSSLETRNRHLLDQSQKPFYLLFAVQRWLTLILDLMVAAMAVILIVLVVQLRGTLGPGFVGVALLNVILFSQSIKLLLTFWTNLETHIGSIARIKSFNVNTASENFPEEKETPPASWPSQGAIRFQSVSAAYKPDEPVLKEVSLSIEAGQKIGLCGRTGSGKSSLVLSIFRMIELTGGRIDIDGLDISHIPRQEIRSRVIGVPQDAYLLAGSVRFNADPKQAVADPAIIDALKSVELWDIVHKKGGLDVDIEQIFLSHGQKQLFCLARAMLRPSTILILDEATSSVDAKTDELMQRVIRERFSSYTIIAVAHKLDSILDYDKVALLDHGSLVEFDSPYDLLQDPSSAFYKLYNSSNTEQGDYDFDDENDTLAD
ncbi:hypothetical protein B7494_g5754 [Chlorociboria aeruginascens]|nr:hypothetical protein B7494_g5754 [Chlorociboria aeruginascens]